MTKKQFYISNLTWGLPLTLIGFIVALVLICTGHKPKRHGGCFYFNSGKSWRSFNLGLVFLTDARDSEHTKNHEFGHAVQNAKYGLLMPFIVCIPSVIRYWYRELKKPTTAYDDIWFEGEATRLGNEYINKWD